MDSSSFGRSQRLITLAQQLRLYKPPPSRSNNSIEEQLGILVSHQQCSSAESTIPIAHHHERSRPNRAAVLICLFEGEEGDMRVILTKRSSKLSTHSGEVSLPGGKTDEDDADDVETAMREAKEEIGLDPSLVFVVAVLEPFITKRGVTVVPVISILFDKKAFNPTPNASEVEAIFDTPQLQMLRKLKQYSILPWKCFSRIRTAEKKRENGWETSIFSISLIMIQRMRSMSYGL